MIARIGLGLARLLLAAALISAMAYILSWRLLWDGPAGSDALYHLHLASWVQGTFPRIDWWYRWDAGGIPYREGYPLAAHWIAVAIARVLGLGVAQGMQAVQAAINPLCALGVYAFGAWRLRRPLAGLAAALLYLLSPMAWTFLVDWGFYANQAGTILFMPLLIAVDTVFDQWKAGVRGWPFRLSALAVMLLGALMGMIAPSFAGVPLVLLLAYVLAIRRGGWRLRARWLLVVTPLLAIGSVLLSAFWALPLQDYLALVGSRQPARVYSPALFSLPALDRVLGLHDLRFAHVEDRMAMTPAVWLPALVGAAAAVWEPRIRAFLALIVFGFLSMTWSGFYALTYSLVLANYLLTFRSGMLYLQFLLPILAGVGLTVVPAVLAGRALRGRAWPARARVTAAAALAAVGLIAAALNVAAFGERVAEYPHRLAYGAFPLDSRDLWKAHQDDECVVEGKKDTALCRSQALSGAFSVGELVNACRDSRGGLREGIPICAAFRDIRAPAWSAADDPLVSATQAWCAGHSDAVCGARYLPVAEQLFNPGRWRPLRLGCFQPACKAGARELGPYEALRALAPERAVLDAHAGSLLMGFHDLVGGGQSYGYAFQLLPTPELNSWMQDSMLERSGVRVKEELAALSGADAVVLTDSQASQAADYRRLAWREISQAPAVYTPPQPTGLAAQWATGTTVLVVGASPGNPSHPYNDLFKRATEGMIPFADAWLVRGRSSFLDDYSPEELARHPILLLLGYRYHSQRAAWDRLDRYVREGGRLYIETGWQYQDPDWNAGASPAALPVADLRWSHLDPQARVWVNGAVNAGWGELRYGRSGWGASSSSAVRPGGEALVKVGDRVVAARWLRGQGRVIWSGMNLIAHAHATQSAEEAQFLADQWQWLLPKVAPAAAIEPQWSGNDRVSLALRPADRPVRVLFKESTAPGWSAELRWPGGTRKARIEPAEMDYMLVRLDSVPVGARLVFQYRPTWRVWAAWALSLGILALFLVGMGRPGLLTGGKRLLGRARARALRGVRARWDDEEDAA